MGDKVYPGSHRAGLLSPQSHASLHTAHHLYEYTAWDIEFEPVCLIGEVIGYRNRRFSFGLQGHVALVNGDP